MKNILLQLFVLSLSTLSLAKGHSQDSHTGNRDQQKTLVYSCNILFPHNSIVFRQERVEECINNIDPEHITYVHVVATATTSGSANYNLELSNRRAKVIGDAIKKSLKIVDNVHVFGGGQNPRFGRQARIFIVVQPHNEGDKEETPVVKTEIEIKRELVLAKRSARGLDFQLETGYADIDGGSFNHDYLNLKLRKIFFLPERVNWRWFVGGNYALLTSTERRDFTLLLAELGARYVWSIPKYEDSYLYCESSLLSGVTSNQSEESFDFGVSALCGVKMSGYGLGISYYYGYQSRQVGIAINIEI